MRLSVSLVLFSAAQCATAVEIPTIDYRTEQSDSTKLIGMECHWRKQTLEIGNFTSLNRPTRRMDFWSADDLVVWNQETSDLVKTLSVERRCKLGAATYTVRFTGAPGNSNAARRCGAFMTAHATVWKNGRKIFDQEFEECMGEERGIATVRFTPASDTPVITRLPTR